MYYKAGWSAMSAFFQLIAGTTVRRLGISFVVFLVFLLLPFAFRHAGPPEWTMTQSSTTHHALRRGGPHASFSKAEVPIEKFASFNKPAILDVGETTEVRAVLSAIALAAGDPNGVFKNLSGAIETTGQIALGSSVTARLTTDPSLMKIIAADDRPQIVVKDRDIGFIWYVTPLVVGSIPIDLSIDTPSGAAPGAPLQMSQVMHENWQVEARGVSGIIYWIQRLQPIQAAIWTVAGGVSSFVTFFGLTRLWQRKVPASEKDARAEPSIRNAVGDPRRNASCRTRDAFV